MTKLFVEQPLASPASANYIINLYGVAPLVTDPPHANSTALQDHLRCKPPTLHGYKLWTNCAIVKSFGIQNVTVLVGFFDLSSQAANILELCS